MSIYTTINVTRGSSNTAIATGIPNVQIDNASETLGAYYDQKHPYDLYHVFIRYTTAVFARGDLITDTVNVDPLTNANAIYRVAGPVRTYPDGHVEMRATKVLGPEGS